MDCSRARRENLEDRAATGCPAGPRRSQMLRAPAPRKTIPPNACSDCNRELRRERDFHRASVPSQLRRHTQGTKRIFYAASTHCLLNEDALSFCTAMLETSRPLAHETSFQRLASVYPTVQRSP